MNSDQYLLQRFISLGDERAFADLLERHGKIVWSVCRRLLNVHDAEDAFQIVLLLFFRKAASIHRPQALASWLYGVAYRTALRLRRSTARRDRLRRDRLRRDRLERLQVSVPRDEAPWSDAAFQELRRLLDQEILALKETERSAFTLRCLQGMSGHAVAGQLGVTETLVRRRVAMARRQLRARLARRGVLHSPAAAAL
jgi:RNA polymerase sigma factor (sigma-70 family)